VRTLRHFSAFIDLLPANVSEVALSRRADRRE